MSDAEKEITRRILDPITFREEVRRPAITECRKVLQTSRLQEKKTVKELTELDLSSEYFYEEEQEALDNLPFDRQGMEILLDYLEVMDSFAGYQYLFANFGMFLPEDTREKMQKRAEQIFGTNIVDCLDR